MTDPFSDAVLRGRCAPPPPAPATRVPPGARRVGLGRARHDRVRGRRAGARPAHPRRQAAHARWARVAAGSGRGARRPTPRTPRFVPLNQRLLKVCHDWQIARGGIPNDHSDPAYDDRVIERLRGVHGGARRILGDLVPAVPRFSGYAVPLRRRVGAARERASANGSRHRRATRTTRSGCSSTRTCCSPPVGSRADEETP